MRLRPQSRPYSILVLCLSDRSADFPGLFTGSRDDACERDRSASGSLFPAEKRFDAIGRPAARGCGSHAGQIGLGIIGTAIVQHPEPGPRTAFQDRLAADQLPCVVVPDKLHGIPVHYPDVAEIVTLVRLCRQYEALRRSYPERDYDP